MSAGESVGETVFGWCEKALGITPNEMFGQTEMNYLVGNSNKRWPAKAGSMGRPYPGHRVAVLDEHGEPAPTGEVGEVALNRLDIHGYPDPVLFLGYWRNEAATQAKFKGDWCLTGDLASIDADGYLWYAGRADDVFKSAGYRIGPARSKAACSAIRPWPMRLSCPSPTRARRRGEGLCGADPEFAQRDRQDIIENLQEHVRERLAPYEYPKEIEFVDELPMTTTGKILRRLLRQREADRALAASKGSA